MSKDKLSINAQGLSRKDRIQQECFVADEGNVFIFCDLNSAEPSVLAHYSQDPNYLNATLRMSGKRPFYDKNGLLMISDPYLMVASKYPLWSNQVRAALEATDYENGISGYEQWVVNDEVVKKRIKKLRGHAKALGLMLVYGAGAKKLVQVAQQMQFELTVKEAQAFKNLFWDTFPLAKKLGEKLEIQYNTNGVIINDFGYALYPEAGYKCLNAVIQSTVSGIIDLASLMFFSENPGARFCVAIHDEIIFQIPEQRLDFYKNRFYKSVSELNRALGWVVPITFGWEVSKTWWINK